MSFIENDNSIKKSFRHFKNHQFELLSPTENVYTTGFRSVTNGHFGVTLGHIGSHVITRGHPIKFHQDTLLGRDVTLGHRASRSVTLCFGINPYRFEVSLEVTNGHMKSPLNISSLCLCNLLT